MHGTHTVWKTIVCAALVGTRGKVRSCPSVIGVFVGLPLVVNERTVHASAADYAITTSLES